MGLDTSHDAWHGAYSAFMRWREKLAEVAGLPPLKMMEGFWEAGVAPYDPATMIFHDPGGKDSVQKFLSGLPIRWECLKPDPLYTLLCHSDCDGEIAAADCGPIADSLERLLPLLSDGDGGGHIGNWRDKTQQFVDGLRRASAANEPLDFH
jgi:hypothetical protein